MVTFDAMLLTEEKLTMKTRISFPLIFSKKQPSKFYVDFFKRKNEMKEDKRDNIDLLKSISPPLHVDTIDVH